MDDLSRREFLEVSAVAGFVALTPAPRPSDLTNPERRTLLAVARTLFRHATADDEPYVYAVSRVAELCKHDPRILAAVDDTIGQVEWLASASFADLSPQQRVQVIRAANDSSSFRILYREILEGLYGSPDAWRLFVKSSEKPRKEA